MANPFGITPEEFIKAIAESVADRVEKGVRKTLSEPQQSKLYEVNKSSPTGPIKTLISIPQAMSDLTEQMMVSNQLTHYATQVNAALLAELQEHRKLSAKINKKAKKKHDDDDDADDE